MAKRATETLGPVLREAVRVSRVGVTDRELLRRYADGHDQAAFAALVGRHTGMVLGVCRRVLAHQQDAEDACQATFLILARKAKRGSWQASVANWLYTTARRVARNALVAAQHRARRERRAAVPEAVPPLDVMTGRELLAALDEELDRLPPRYREPLVLCCLEGLTRDEAARRLGVPAATVKSQLERGRQRLGDALTRRGCVLGAGLLALAATSPAGASSPRLVQAVLTAASGSAPAAVAELAEGVAMNGLMNKAVLLALGLIGTAALGTGVALTPLMRAGQPPDQAVAAKVAETPPALEVQRPPDDKDLIVLRGQVFGPDGKPFAGAKLYVCNQDGRMVAPQPTAGADGRFRFTLAKPPVTEARAVLATADGLGVDWANFYTTLSECEATLRLPADVPVRGRVVDLEGRPVARASVRIVELNTTESGNLDDALKAWTADKEKQPIGDAYHRLTARGFCSWEPWKHFPAATTSPDGTFRLTGIGRDRVLLLGIRGPGIADQYVRLVTRPDFQTTLPGEGQVTLSGPEPTVAVSPHKPIVGTVRDAQTKQPLAGIRVSGYTPDQPTRGDRWHPVETVTDAEGRYRLDGLAKTSRQIVLCEPGPGAIHLHRFDEVADTSGFAPIAHDAELHRGVVISGQVIDKSTGRPVRAEVLYRPLANNEYFDATPGYARPHTPVILEFFSREMTTDADGRYRLTALPGSGVLFVRASTAGAEYTHPAAPPKGEQDPAIYNSGEYFYTSDGGGIHPLRDLHAYRMIRPSAETKALTADFALDPGISRKGRLLDPEGRLLVGTEARGLSMRYVGSRLVLPSAEFTAVAINPAMPRRLLFRHVERKLAGTVVLRGDEPEPVTVTLRPLAALTGRAVSKTTGEPLVGYTVEYSAQPEVWWPVIGRRDDPPPPTVITDNDGRFRIPDLPAGVPLYLYACPPKSRFEAVKQRNIILEPGQTKNLGDLRGQREPDKP